jgi:WD40 repeat protein
MIYTDRISRGQRRLLFIGVPAAITVGVLIGALLWGHQRAEETVPRLPEVVQLPGSESTRSLAFAPDGKSLVIGSLGAGLRVVGLARTPLREDEAAALPADVTEIPWPEIDRKWMGSLGLKALAVSPDGRAVALAGDAGPTRRESYLLDDLYLPVGVAGLWDLGTGKWRARWSYEEGAKAIDISPDDKLFAVSASFVEIRDTATGDLVQDSSSWHSDYFRANSGGVYQVVFSPDGKTVAMSGGDEVVLLDLGTRKLTLLKIDGLSGETPQAIAFSPDGRLLAAVGDRLRLWDTGTRSPVADFPMDHRDSMVTFAPDSKSFVTAGEAGDAVRLWDVSTRKPIATMPEKRGFYTIAFSPDGTTVALGTNYSGPGWSNVVMWNVTRYARPE